jgi:hypothetical protein
MGVGMREAVTMVMVVVVGIWWNHLEMLYYNITDV